MPYHWVVVFLALVSLMGSAWPLRGIPVLYPFIQEELALSRAQLGLITSLLVGGGIITGYLSGWLTDAFGVKRLVVIPLIVMGLLMTTFPFISTFYAILALGLLIGMFQSPGYPAATRAIMDWVPLRTRGLATSLMLTGAPLGGTVAAAALPAIALAFGWRFATVILGSLVVAIGGILFLAYRDKRVEGVERPRMNLANLRILLQNRNLMLAAIWASVFAGLNVTVLTYVLLFLVDQLNISAIAAGGYLAIAQIISIPGRVIWGATSDLLFGGRRRIVLGILGLASTAALLWTSLVDVNVSGLVDVNVSGLVVVALVGCLSITVMSWHGLFTVFVSELGSQSHIGMSLGAVDSVMRVSVILMPPMFGLLVDITDSYAIGWSVAAVLSLVSTLVFMGFGADSKPKPILSSSD